MMKKKVEPPKTRTTHVHHSMAIFEKGDILRRLKGGYIRVLEIREVPVQRPRPASATFAEPVTPAEASLETEWTTAIEMTYEECDRPGSGLYVVGVWKE